MKQIEWSEEALEDMAALQKRNARQIKAAVERFAEHGTGKVKKLQGVGPPEFRLRAGDFRVRFRLPATRSSSCACSIAKTLTVNG